jgi:hypothetical protein
MPRRPVTLLKLIFVLANALSDAAGRDPPRKRFFSAANIQPADPQECFSVQMDVRNRLSASKSSGAFQFYFSKCPM